MSNGIVDQLVGQEALDQLLKLQQQLNSSAESMQQLIDKSATFRKELAGVTSMVQLNAQLEKQAKLSKEASAEQEKQHAVLAKLEKQRERLASLSSEEAKELERVRQAIADKNRELRNSVRQEKEAEDSITGMSGKLNLLRQDYEKLSEAQRKSAEGKQLLANIQSLDTEYKKLRGSMGQFQANVGDYEGAILSATGANKGFLGSILNMTGALDKSTQASDQGAKGAGRLAAGFKQGVASVQAFGKQLLKLLANPIVAILAAIAAAIMLVVKAIKGSEENSNKLSKALMPLKRVFEAIMGVIQVVVGVILDFINAIWDAISAIAELFSWIPFIGSALDAANASIKDAIKLAEDQAKLAKREREILVGNAERAKHIAALRAEAEKKDQYTAKERLGMIRDAAKLEEETARKNKELAEERLRLKLKENELSDNSAEDEKEIAQLRADVHKADLEYYDKVRSLQKQVNTFKKELAAEEKADADSRRNALNTYAEYEAAQVKKGADDEKRSLDDRLKSYGDYVNKKAAIINRDAQAEVDAAEGNTAKLAEIAAKRNVALQQLRDELAEFERTQSERLQKQTSDAQEQILQLQLNRELECLKELADSEEASYNTRMEAAQTYADMRVAEANRIADKEIEEANGVQALIDLANERRVDAIAKANDERDEVEVKAIESRAEKIVRAVEESIRQEESVRSKQQSDEEAELSRQLASKNMTREQYDQARLDLVRKYAKLAFDAEVKQLEALLSSEWITAEERIKVEQRLQDARVKYAKEANEQIVADNDKAAKKQEDAAKKLANLRKELINELVNLIHTAIMSSMEARIEAYDQQIEQINTEKDTRLAALEEVGMSEENRAAQKKQLEEQAAAQTKVLEEKKKQEQLKQANFQRTWSIAEVAIKTALAVMEVAANIPPPLNVPLIAATIALGGVQAASIMAQKVPAYAEGTDFHPGGLAFMGDGGVKEGVILPDGRLFLSADTPTLYDLPRGTKVIPEMGELGSRQSHSFMDVVKLNDEASARNTAKIINAIKSSRASLSVNMDARGIWKAVEGNQGSTTTANQSIYKR